jgi:HD-GYP domain-containing protein (c-di-GMP phosphodiesterase class II)
MPDNNDLLKKLDRLNAIGVALSAEHDTPRLLETILLGAKEITNADGGTLYSVTEDKRLRFEIMRTRSLGLAMGGTTGTAIPFPPLPLYLEDGRPNNAMVAVHAALTGATVNIGDAYAAEGFDFSGTRKFDQKTGYRSKSFLTVPMRNHEGEIIGVLQLINAMDQAGGIIPFSDESRQLAESLASQAAVALTNHNLIEGLKGLFESFIKLIAEAVDKKSPYTGGHCRRVPELTMLLAEAANAAEDGSTAGFRMTPKELYELKIAAWLHDCGKVTTPEYVVDKATKLSTLFDRIELAEARLRELGQAAEIDMLRRQLAALKRGGTPDYAGMDRELTDLKRGLAEDKAFLRNANTGAEFMPPEQQARVRSIGAREFTDWDGNKARLLTDDEIKNLTVRAGTLNDEERRIINSHIDVTISMLSSLKYPRDLRRVPEYAGAHHERMDGKGYPRGLNGSQLTVQARMLAIADVFEALTAADRPYKKAKTLSESLSILGKMAAEGHVDKDLFRLFVKEKVYLKYAKAFLKPEQLDEVDEKRIPGYVP